MKLPEAVERNIQLLRKLIQIKKKRNYPKMTPQAERMFGALASNWMNHEPIRVKEAVLIDTSRENHQTLKQLKSSPNLDGLSLWLMKRTIALSTFNQLNWPFNTSRSMATHWISHANPINRQQHKGRQYSQLPPTQIDSSERTSSLPLGRSDLIIFAPHKAICQN